MAALNAPIEADSDVRENVSPKPLDKGRAFDGRSGRSDHRQMHGARWKACERCLEPADAVLDLPDPHPHARIDVAFGPHDDLDGCQIVRRIRQANSGVARAPPGPPDIAGGRKLPWKRGAAPARAGGAV